jgi:hypothetical protein
MAKLCCLKTKKLGTWGAYMMCGLKARTRKHRKATASKRRRQLIKKVINDT